MLYFSLAQPRNKKQRYTRKMSLDEGERLHHLHFVGVVTHDPRQARLPDLLQLLLPERRLTTPVFVVEPIAKLQKVTQRHQRE